MNATPPGNNNRDFFRVVQFSAALGIGSMAAFLYSLKQVHPSVRLELGLGTLVVFLGAAIFSWMFCGMLAKAGIAEVPGGDRGERARHGKSLKRWVVVFTLVCGLATIAAFAYSLKDVSAQARRDVVGGTVIACLVLAAGGWLIRRAVQFFEEDSAAQLEQHPEEEKSEEE
jgi:hypothetical protein